MAIGAANSTCQIVELGRVERVSCSAAVIVVPLVEMTTRRAFTVLLLLLIGSIKTLRQEISVRSIVTLGLTNVHLG